jgi:RNA polymerase sigma factor (sigma-70 family)
MENDKRNRRNNTVLTEAVGNEGIKRVKILIADNRFAAAQAARHYNRLYGFRLHADELDDAVQNALCKAIANAEYYDSRKASVATWLSRIVGNEIVDRLHEKNISYIRSIPYSDEPDEEGYYDDSIRQMHFRLEESVCPSGHLEHAEAIIQSRNKAESIMKAVHALSYRDQVVVALLLRNLSGAEMAKRLKLSESAQRKLVHDVRKRLRRKMNELKDKE